MYRHPSYLSLNVYINISEYMFMTTHNGRVWTRAINEFAKWPPLYRHRCLKGRLQKGNKTIFYDNQNLNLDR